MPSFYEWIKLSEIEILDFDNAEYKKILLNWISEIENKTVPHNRALWEVRGWYNNTEKWIRDNLQKTILNIEQIKGAWSWSSILKINTIEETLYFKADYKKLPHEVDTIRELNKLYKYNFPSVVISDYSNNWMVMKDFGDLYLEKLDFNHYVKAVKKYAEIQIKSVGEIERFKKINCRYISLNLFTLYLEQLVDDKILLIGPYKLTNYDLEQFKKAIPCVIELCKKLDLGRIPYTINNEDFRDQNVVLYENDFIYFDWSNTTITHPFFSFTYFLNRINIKKNHIGKEMFKGSVEKVLLKLTEEYLKMWVNFDEYESILQIFKEINSLYNLYQAIRCYIELPYLEENCPWYIDCRDIVPNYIKKFIDSQG